MYQLRSLTVDLDYIFGPDFYVGLLLGRSQTSKGKCVAYVGCRLSVGHTIRVLNVYLLTCDQCTEERLRDEGYRNVTRSESGCHAEYLLNEERDQVQDKEKRVLFHFTGSCKNRG